MIDSPKILHTYEDYGGRNFEVRSVDPQDYFGREVRGDITTTFQGKEIIRIYSCTLDMWKRTWRDKSKPVDPSKMKIG